MGKQIKIYQTESFTTYVVREGITIDLDDYPELEGMTNEEIVDYLEYNCSDMKSMDGEFYDSLSDELMDKDVIKEKISGEDFSFKVENID